MRRFRTLDVPKFPSELRFITEYLPDAKEVI